MVLDIPNPVIDAYRDVVPIEDGVQQRAQMSFTSTVYAERANKVKKGWIVELAIAYASKHWEKVQVQLEKMSEYEFSE